MNEKDSQPGSGARESREGTNFPHAAGRTRRALSGSSPLLRENLRALTARNAALAARLALPVDDSHLALAEDGAKILYRLRNDRVALGEVSQIADLKQDKAPNDSYTLFGIGDGSGLKAVLDESGTDLVRVWDRDPALMRLALSLHDLTAPLREGRLRLHLGVDLLDSLEELRRGTRVVSPLARSAYANELRILNEGLKEQRVLLCGGELLRNDLSQIFHEKGFSVYVWEVSRLAAEELIRTLRRFDPDFVFSVNYVHGLGEVCAEAGCPLTCWEIDPSTDELEPLRAESDQLHIYTYRRRNVRPFRDAGFTNVRYLPLASNTRRRRPLTLSADEQRRYGAPVAFVGASMVENARENLAEFKRILRACLPAEAQNHLNEGIERVLAHQAEEPHSYLIAELLTDQFSELAARISGNALARLAQLLAETAASRKRLNYVESLGEFGVDVWGDAGWVGPGRRKGVHYRGSAGYDRELSRIYCASRINLDINRIYQPDIVTLRIFDILACGGFVLTERNEALGELFEIGREIEAYRTLGELREKIRFYLAHPEVRDELARRGREAVLKRHSMRERLGEMVGEVVGGR